MPRCYSPFVPVSAIPRPDTEKLFMTASLLQITILSSRAISQADTYAKERPEISLALDPVQILYYREPDRDKSRQGIVQADPHPRRQI